MPNPTCLLIALYLVIIATSAGAVYAILTEGGELLAFIPKWVTRRTVQYHKDTDEIVRRTGWRRWVLKFSTCGKCIAGQFAFWLFFPLIGYGSGFTWSLVLLQFVSVTVSILTASIIILYVGSRS